jgi:hypothetical protein
MDGVSANELCRKAGVSDVPAGVDPSEWLEDNDVFFDESFGSEAAEAEVVREVFGPRRAKAEEDGARIGATLGRLRSEGYVHTTALGYDLDWKPIDSGPWDAAGSAPNELSAGYWSYRVRSDRPVAVRHCYGNAVGYYVLPDLLESCLEAWWSGQLRVGFRAAENDPVAGIRWAATHTLDLADHHPDCLGGDDAVRFVALAGREKLERLAAL